MPLYPVLASSATESGDQRFRLSAIKEHDEFLTREAETRRTLNKKYQKAINAVDGLRTGVAMTGVLTEATGITLMLTGFGIIPGMILAGLGIGSFAVEFASGRVGRKLIKKASKHALIMQCAIDKRNSIHRQVSDALRDGHISAEEFDRIAEEVTHYNETKLDIQAKARSDAAEKTDSKNAWMEAGREEIRAEFTKYMAAFGVTQK